jgi:hypothetical protein
MDTSRKAPAWQAQTGQADERRVIVIEVEVPALQRLPPGETVRAFTVTPTHLGFDEYDIAAQGLVSHHYWVIGGQLETFSSPFRYVWPSELDLMARLAGMTLARALERLEAQALHQRQHHIRFGLGEDGVALDSDLRAGCRILTRCESSDGSREGRS